MTATYKYYRSSQKGPGTVVAMVSKGSTKQVSWVCKELRDLDKWSAEEEAGKDKMCNKGSEEGTCPVRFQEITCLLATPSINSLPNAGQDGKPDSIRMLETSSWSFQIRIQSLS